MKKKQKQIDRVYCKIKDHHRTEIHHKKQNRIFLNRNHNQIKFQHMAIKQLTYERQVSGLFPEQRRQAGLLYVVPFYFGWLFFAAFPENWCPPCPRGASSTKRGTIEVNNRIVNSHFKRIIRVLVFSKRPFKHYSIQQNVCLKFASCYVVAI